MSTKAIDGAVSEGAEVRVVRRKYGAGDFRFEAELWVDGEKLPDSCPGPTALLALEKLEHHLGAVAVRGVRRGKDRQERKERNFARLYGTPRGRACWRCQSVCAGPPCPVCGTRPAREQEARQLERDVERAVRLLEREGYVVRKED